MRRAGVAFLVGALAVLASPSASQGADPCQAAKALGSARQESDAIKAYIGLLNAETSTSTAPTRACAKQGLISLLRHIDLRKCAVAKTYEDLGLTDQAAKTYDGLLESHTTTDGGKRCAREGRQRIETLEARAFRSYSKWVDRVLPGQSPRAGGRVSVAVCVLVLLLLLVAVRLGRRWWDRRTAGPVLVKQVMAAGKADTASQARVRELLSELGCPPLAESTYGAIADTLSVVVAVGASETQRSLITALLRVVRTILPGIGLTVDIEILTRDEAPKHGVTVQVLHRRNGKTLLVDTIWKESVDDALLAAAARTHQAALDQPRVRKGTPVWARWTTPNEKALLEYKRGRDAERDGKADIAIAAYDRALALEPVNILIRHALGRATEPTPNLLRALSVHLTSVRLAPRLAEAWYRLACTYGYLAEPAEAGAGHAWRGSSSRVRDDLRALIAAAHPSVQEALPEDARVDDIRAAFLRLAADAWLQVRACFRATSILRSFWTRAGRASTKGLARPFSRRRFAYRASAQAMRLATRLQLDAAPRAVRTKLNRMRWWSWYWHRDGAYEAHYNFACAYARLRDATMALKELQKSFAVDSADMAVELKWTLEVDPDLRSLRSSPDFKLWLNTLIPVVVQTPKKLQPDTGRTRNNERSARERAKSGSSRRTGAPGGGPARTTRSTTSSGNRSGG